MAVSFFKHKIILIKLVILLFFLYFTLLGKVFDPAVIPAQPSPVALGTEKLRFLKIQKVKPLRSSK